MAYCTNTQAILFFDSNLLGQLVLDNGAQATEAQLATNPKLTAALSAASGEINMAAQVSDRYEVSDLESLTGDDAMRLAELCAWLAIPRLLGRRNPSIEKYPEIEEAQLMLQAIREGIRIFPVEKAELAGLASMVDNKGFGTRPLVSGPCRAGRFFGTRGWQMGDTCCQSNNSGCGC